jgi:hypothetical protein
MYMKHTKKIFAAMLIVACCAGALSAHGMKRAPQWGRGQRMWRGDAAETVTVNGKLQLVNGQIAVVQNSKTYYTMGLNRLVGFIEGLKEGADVTLEGYARSQPYNSGSFVLMVTKLSLNGKEYSNLLGYPLP